MTRHLDPDRSPAVELFPFPIDIETGVCNRCSGLIPMTDVAKQNHRDHHAQVDALAAGFATVAVASQLSGSGSRTATPAGVTADASPDPAPKSPPTPPEEATAGPGGAEGSNDGTEADAAAGTSLGDVTEAPAAFPPAAGATKRVGRGSGDVGESTVSAPADTNRSRPAADLGRETTGRLRLPELEPGDYRRFAR